MDAANANSLADSMLNTKVEIPTSCEQNIQLTKMEIVDPQSNVHLENAASHHIVEYINLHRVSDIAKNLIADSIPPELLSHTVVDLGSNQEYSQHLVTNAQFYENADFLSSSFSDDDRRPNIVAVGVQLIQSNRPDSASDDTDLSSDLLDGKTPLPSVSTISNEKSVMSSIVPTYVQAVDPTVSRSSGSISMHINANHAQVTDQHLTKESAVQHNNHIIKLYQPLMQNNKLSVLPPLKKIDGTAASLSSGGTKYLTDENGCNTQTIIVSSNLSSIQMQHQIPEPLDNVKTECSDHLSTDLSESLPTEGFESDRDNEARCSQKSLPHKKRIPNKLKKALTAQPMRNIHTKCYKCPKCGEQFPTQAAFNVHKQEQHSSKKVNFACELCNKTCPNQLKFFEHLKSHYEPSTNLDCLKSEVLQSVEQEFDQSTEIESADTNEAEQQQETENQDHSLYSDEQHKTLTCGKCGRVFRRQKAFDCHMSISHPKQEDIEEFSEPEDMMEGIRHVVNMVPTGDDEDKTYEPWQSPPKSIENIIIPSQPVSQNVTASIPTTTTVATVKTITNPKSLKLEVKKEDPDFLDDEMVPVKPRKEMSCPHCERTFVHRNSLLYHIRSHTGHRPHQCELCGKSFFAAGALKIHLRLHSGDKPYKCEYCGRFFRQWGDLKYHITSLHSNTKMFQCEYCGKDFARKYSLVVHRRIHTGEKNYICEYCTKTFRAASYLQNHRRIHTGEKPHTCQVCGKPFRVRSDMKRHMKTHPENVVNVLSELSNRTTESSTSSRHINNQELAAPKQEDVANVTISDAESDQNIKPVMSETTASLDMNTSAETNQSELFDYQRDSLDDDRESTNAGTLYVWIQASSDTILPDP